jgi:PKD repeat protein
MDRTRFALRGLYIMAAALIAAIAIVIPGLIALPAAPSAAASGPQRAIIFIPGIQLLHVDDGAGHGPVDRGYYSTFKELRDWLRAPQWPRTSPELVYSTDPVAGTWYAFAGVNYFSYAPDGFLGTYYGSDTRQHLEISARALSQQIGMWGTQGKVYDIIAHSLGGAVAATWAATETDPAKLAAVRSIITLDSPVNGISSGITEVVGKYLDLKVLGGDAGEDLFDDGPVAIMRAAPNRKDIVNLANADDAFVNATNATLPGTCPLTLAFDCTPHLGGHADPLIAHGSILHQPWTRSTIDRLLSDDTYLRHWSNPAPAPAPAPAPVGSQPSTSSSDCRAPAGWELGAVVGLRAEAELWQGPGLGTPFVLPSNVEQPFLVKVISDPVCPPGTGKMYIDTSRRALDLLSTSGTGWAVPQQATYNASTAGGSSLISAQFNPSSMPVGQSSAISIRVADSSYNALRVSFGCGSPSTYELGSPTVDFLFSSSGCPAGTRGVVVSARRSDDPGWERAISATFSMNLSPAPIIPPDFDFVADTATTCQAPCTVQFSIRTYGGVNRVSWSFGDGATSADYPRTSHQYMDPGTYQVSLSGSGDGGSKTVTKPNFITVTPPPPSAMVVKLSCDEGSGAVCHDLSGHGNDAQLLTSTWTQGFQGGSALHRPGQDGAGARIAPSSSLCSSTFTFSAYLRQPRGQIASQGESGSNNERWSLSTDEGRLVLQIWPTGGVRSETDYLAGTDWFAISVDFDGQNVRFWRDGVLYSTARLPLGGISDRACTLYLGSLFGTGWSSGDIDEVRYYNIVVTPTPPAPVATETATVPPSPSVSPTAAVTQTTPTLSPVPSATSPWTPHPTNTLVPALQRLIGDFTSDLSGWWTSGPVTTFQENGNTSMRFTPPAGGASEASTNLSGTLLKDYADVCLRVNPRDQVLGGGDSSALYFQQDGWRFVAIRDFVPAGATGWTSLCIPLARFPGLKLDAPVAGMGIRVWMPVASTVDFDDIRLVGAGAPNPVQTPLPTSVPTSLTSQALPTNSIAPSVPASAATPTKTATRTPTMSPTQPAAPSSTRTPAPSATSSPTPTPIPTQTMAPTSTATAPGCVRWEDFANNASARWTRFGSAAVMQLGADYVMRFTPAAGAAAEVVRSASGLSLASCSYVELVLNVTGGQLQDGDASAFYVSQGGAWRYNSISRYITQKSTQTQRIRIPLSDLSGFNKTAPFSTIGVRIWSQSGVTFDISEISFG